MNLKIISASSELSRDMPGYYVATGEGETFRVFGWAATTALAKRLRADVRKNAALYAAK